jgi:hypothetical protein
VAPKSDEIRRCPPWLLKTNGSVSIRSSDL